MECMSILALLTDFGWQDPYVAIVKGVLLGINSTLSIIDITHSIPPQDIHTAAFFLSEAVPYFPKETIFMAVVDPGVGSERDALVCKTEEYYFTCPDNGILTLVFQKARQRNEPVICHKITEKRFCLSEIGRTFHARDIFAPVAGHLSLGTPLSAFGPEKFDPAFLTFSSPKIFENTIEGEVRYVDGFGNLITNIHANHLTQLARQPSRVNIAHIDIPIRTAYSQVEFGQPLAILGSYGLLEIAVRNGNAASVLQVKTGHKVIVTG